MSFVLESQFSDCRLKIRDRVLYLLQSMYYDISLPEDSCIEDTINDCVELLQFPNARFRRQKLLISMYHLERVRNVFQNSELAKRDYKPLDKSIFSLGFDSIYPVHCIIEEICTKKLPLFDLVIEIILTYLNYFVCLIKADQERDIGALLPSDDSHSPVTRSRLRQSTNLSSVSNSAATISGTSGTVVDDDCLSPESTYCNHGKIKTFRIKNVTRTIYSFIKNPKCNIWNETSFQPNGYVDKIIICCSRFVLKTRPGNKNRPNRILVTVSSDQRECVKEIYLRFYPSVQEYVMIKGFRISADFQSNIEKIIGSEQDRPLFELVTEIIRSSLEYSMHLKEMQMKRKCKGEMRPAPKDTDSHATDECSADPTDSSVSSQGISSSRKDKNTLGRRNAPNKRRKFHDKKSVEEEMSGCSKNFKVLFEGYKDVKIVTYSYGRDSNSLVIVINIQGYLFEGAAVTKTKAIEEASKKALLLAPFILKKQQDVL